MNGADPDDAADPRPHFSDYLKAWPQYLLPHHLLSRGMRWLTRRRWRPFRLWQIRRFIRYFGVDLSEARITDEREFEHFNAFFTRALKPGARPIEGDDNTLACPVDGTVSQAGPIDPDGRIFQAKGRRYSVLELLGGRREEADRYAGGIFVTIYLAPKNYHRIHMPLAGRLRETCHVPGRIFSVNPPTTRAIPRLFARNERVVADFDGPAGPYSLVMVGAMLVSSVETVWAGEITPPTRADVRTWPASDARGTTEFRRGEEMGRFNMGSTVILLFPPDTVQLDDSVQPGTVVRMGQSIGRLLA